MAQAGIERANADFYEAFDQAVGRSMIQIVTDLGRLYPNTRLSVEHLERISGINGGYELDFIKPTNIEGDPADNEDVELDDYDVDTIDEVEDEEWDQSQN